MYNPFRFRSLLLPFVLIILFLLLFLPLFRILSRTSHPLWSPHQLLLQQSDHQTLQREDLLLQPPVLLLHFLDLLPQQPGSPFRRRLPRKPLRPGPIRLIITLDDDRLAPQSSPFLRATLRLSRALPGAPFPATLSRNLSVLLRPSIEGVTIDDAWFLESSAHHAGSETPSHWNETQLPAPLALLARAPSITRHQQYNPRRRH